MQQQCQHGLHGMTQKTYASVLVFPSETEDHMDFMVDTLEERIHPSFSYLCNGCNRIACIEDKLCAFPTREQYILHQYMQFKNMRRIGL
jgi:biotin synthase-related radical SAM superfamily protein